MPGPSSKKDRISYERRNYWLPCIVLKPRSVAERHIHMTKIRTEIINYIAHLISLSNPSLWRDSLKIDNVLQYYYVNWFRYAVYEKKYVHMHMGDFEFNFSDICEIQGGGEFDSKKYSLEYILYKIKLLSCYLLPPSVRNFKFESRNQKCSLTIEDENPVYSINFTHNIYNHLHTRFIFKGDVFVHKYFKAAIFQSILSHQLTEIVPERIFYGLPPQCLAHFDIEILSNPFIAIAPKYFSLVHETDQYFGSSGYPIDHKLTEGEKCIINVPADLELIKQMISKYSSPKENSVVIMCFPAKLDALATDILGDELANKYARKVFEFVSNLEFDHKYLCNVKLHNHANNSMVDSGDYYLVSMTKNNELLSTIWQEWTTHSRG